MSDVLRVARLVDAVQYALGLSAAVTVLLLPVSLAVGSGLTGVKYGLFLFGVLSMGYATLLAWPRSPSDLETEGVDREETWFQGLLRRLPPAAWYPLAPEERYLDWTRLYLATVCLWLSSFALEAVLGV
ncbi:MAG: DUF7555 family protein [Halodesulfurarchaeum sp.]